MEPVITFPGIQLTGTARALVEKRFKTIEPLAPHMTGRAMVIDMLQKRRVHGRIVQAHLPLALPVPEMPGRAQYARGSARDDLELAVNRAFRMARRHLVKNRCKKRWVEVKHHAPVHHGAYDGVEPDLGCRCARDQDGRDG